MRHVMKPQTEGSTESEVTKYFRHMSHISFLKDSFEDILEHMRSKNQRFLYCNVSSM